ncbi:hypothetical protein T01_4541 [Trichinella spiralis]|uniref:Uncharacterized protein n=1 Tax=Trichinella spiralis TaxID=6334 RepID=A0A0V1C028_TRISP|nr:hypothetical protein T01_4541 [Trichinella spiralis]
MKRQPEAKFSAVLAFCSLTVPQFNIEIVLARSEIKASTLLVVRQPCMAMNEKLKMKSECIKADENQNI